MQPCPGPLSRPGKTERIVQRMQVAASGVNHPCEVGICPDKFRGFGAREQPQRRATTLPLSHPLADRFQRSFIVYGLNPSRLPRGTVDPQPFDQIEDKIARAT